MAARNLTLAVLGALWRCGPAAQPRTPPPAPKTVRLYVFDCGLLNITPEGVQRYHVTPAEVGETRMSVPCFLVAHPKGHADVGPRRHPRRRR